MKKIHIWSKTFLSLFSYRCFQARPLSGKLSPLSSLHISSLRRSQVLLQFVVVKSLLERLLSRYASKSRRLAQNQLSALNYSALFDISFKERLLLLLKSISNQVSFKLRLASLCVRYALRVFSRQDMVVRKKIK